MQLSRRLWRQHAALNNWLNSLLYVLFPATRYMKLLATSHLIHIIFMAYYVILLARVVFSWIPFSARAPALLELRSFCYRATDPLLRPIRRLLAPYQKSSPVDFSPLILIVVLSIVERIVLQLLGPM